MLYSSIANVSAVYPQLSPSTSSKIVSVHQYHNLSVHQCHNQKSISFLQRSPSLRISFHSKILSAITPERLNNPSSNYSITKLFVHKLSLLVFGSVIFVGTFSFQPSPSLSWVKSAPLEEKASGRDEVRDGHVKLLESNPRDLNALKMAFYGEVRRGKTEEAVKYVERMIVVEPDEVEWRLLQALSYEQMGQLEKAKKMFQDILEKKPLLIRALHGLALVMQKNGETVAAFDMLNKALELARREERVPEERNIQILIAQMHVVKGNLEVALKRFQKLVDENPRDFRPFFCQGLIYSLQDKKKEAEEQFEIYRSLVPDEFPQKGLLDDVILQTRTESQEHIQKNFGSEFSFKK